MRVSLNMLALGWAVFAVTACAHRTVPKLMNNRLSPDLPYCDEVPDPGPSQLAELVEELAIPEQHTGVMLLERGASALIARAWLVENAVDQIDAQYFIFSADTAGIVATDALLLAAERGVRVRLLVDDTLAHGDPHLLHALSMHPNAEVRIYNPLLNVGQTVGQTLKNIFGDFASVNQRMHNKLFIADGRVAITGGRNMGNEYFDLARSNNFRDRDVLLIEGEVADASASFAAFWEHPLARPIEELLDPRTRHAPEAVWERMHQFACNPSNFLPTLRARVNAVPTSLRTRVADGLMHAPSRVEYVSDAPGKNPTGTLGGGGASTDALIALVNQASESIVIQTPYLVTTERGEAVFRAAVERGVSVRILTNSLAATDSLVAFSGYKRRRNGLLNAGVELYESKPQMAVQAELMNGPLEPRYRGSMALHAKSMVIDRRIAVVGSFNLDPRSANLNTESVTIIHSPEVAHRLLDRMEQEMSADNAWRRTATVNPDKHSPLFRRFRVFLSGVVPVSVL